MAIPIFIWGFIQSFIVGTIIAIVKRAKSNFLLSGIFLIISFNILFQYLLRYKELKYSHPKFLVLPDILDLVLPTLVLIYINYILGKVFNKRSYGYLGIPLLWSSVLILYTILSPNFVFDTYIGTTFHKLSLLIIFLWKTFLFYKAKSIYDKQLKMANAKTVALFFWPKVLIIFIGLLTYIAFISMLYWVVVGTDYEGGPFTQIMQSLVELNYLLFTSSIIFITIFFAFKYPKTLAGPPIVKSVDNATIPNGKKLLMLLNKLISEDKIHLDSEFNEKKLAQAMNIPLYLLSKLINDYLGKSFSEFINEKRIEEAKRLLTTEANKDLTVFAVAIDSGFKSESVFYVNFKKQTGCTPMGYKKKMLQHEVSTS